MKVVRYVDKKVIWLIFAVAMICSAITLYFGTAHRFTYASKYENYSAVGGRVNSLEEYEHEDSDDRRYYTYSAEIEYTVDGVDYIQVTDDIFHEDDVPEEGRKIPILYNNDNPDDYVVAKEDWMTRSLVPLSDKGDGWLFTCLILFSFALMLAAMALDNDQVRGIILGFGLLLLGIDGVVMGIITRNFAMCLLIIFGAVGAYVLYRYLFVPRERREREEAASESLRMLRAVEVYGDPQNGRNIIVFSMMEDNGNTVHYFSYDDYNQRFHRGEIYQIIKDEAMGFDESRQVYGFDTIDISGIDENAIQELNPLLKKIASGLVEVGKL